MPMMFVNLPVTDLERAKAFYEALGFSINPLFTDHNAACVVVEDGHDYFMILKRDFFQTFTDLPIGDPAVSPAVATATDGLTALSPIGRSVKVWKNSRTRIMK